MWNRTYIKQRWPKDIDNTTRDRRIIEALISLHRMRGERFIEGRHFYLLRNPREDTEDEIAIGVGFADPLSEQLMDQRNAWRVPDAALAIVRSAVGV